MALQDVLEELRKELSEIAYKDCGVVGWTLAKLEESTKIKRNYFVHGAISIFAAYLILGRSAALLCNLVGFVYPAYASIKAIESIDKGDDTQWLTYWTVFAFFSIIEFASDLIVSWFPFYWLTKFLFMLWLCMPMTRGAEIVYENVLIPLMEKFKSRLEEIKKEFQEQLRIQAPVEKQTRENGAVAMGNVPVPNGQGQGDQGMVKEEDSGSEEVREEVPFFGNPEGHEHLIKDGEALSHKNDNLQE